MGKENERLETLDSLVDAVLASSKYRHISKELILHIGAQELHKRRTLKGAVKETKNKLHQVAGAYLDTRGNYAVWLNELSMAVHSGNRDYLLHVCAKIMSYHASTRERLPVLDKFYTQIFTSLPPIHTILDIACGLNPLAIPWMPLTENTQYYAYDIYSDMMDFLAEWMKIINIEGYARASDVLQHCPTDKVDVALLLKAIPCLEQIDKSAGSRLLKAINADHLVVSFPVHSLGGRSKGMLEHYEARFYELVKSEEWEVKRLEFSSELVFVVKK